ncbi:glycosyltransferase family 4 protein [Pseudodesulfovibrio mercurii]|uniref:glycosyltransferase family 4 protein n=1 Tax=Pseudodesulfovibrio mercurii TaxID=641491 RepID=UPI0002FA61F0|nr:glycosyltransferase family 1 protein [Pseudodesulfovibrio mercurii]
MFWKLPPSLSFLIRLALHHVRERRLLSLSRKFDVYHETAMFPFRVQDGVATLLTVHDLSLERYPQFHPAERVRYFNRFFGKRLRLADAFVSVSDFTRHELLSAHDLDSRTVAVTPLACDKDLFHHRQGEEVEAVKRELGIRGDYFLSVGTNDPRKNLPLIFEAVHGSPDTQMVIAGWSGWGGKLPGGVRDVGYVSDQTLACLYSGATALVYPSLYEGFGLPVLEAMSCGCPVVLTREASLPEVAGEAGCYLSGPRAVEELVSIMERLGTDEAFRREKSAASLERAELFSWERTALLTKEAILAAYRAKHP